MRHIRVDRNKAVDLDGDAADRMGHYKARPRCGSRTVFAGVHGAAESAEVLAAVTIINAEIVLAVRGRCHAAHPIGLVLQGEQARDTHTPHTPMHC